MMVSVHAAVGAAIGSRVRGRTAAFAAGVVSHLICDLLPHKDYDIKTEAVLAAGVFAYLARTYGVDSPQFIGACGAIAPDAENALDCVGLLPHERTVFPTHNESAPWFLGHGHKVDSPLPQILLAAVCLAIAGSVRPAPE